MGGSGCGKSTLLRHLIGLLLSPHQIRDVVSLKLALVGLAEFEDFYSSELSGRDQDHAGGGEPEDAAGHL
jgi:ABC-type transporter Mla maintaining outer membrane lipid asymmetry ATPase subunit MlaF